MGDVLVAVAVAVVFLVVLGLVVIRYRRQADDVHSVDGYRHTLETLQGIRSQRPSGFRVMDQPPGDQPPGDQPLVGQPLDGPLHGESLAGRRPDPSAHPLPELPEWPELPGHRVRMEPSEAARTAGPRRPLASSRSGPIVFEDASLGGTAVPHGERRGSQTQSRAITAMNHRPRRLAGPVLAGLAVIVLVAVLFLLGSRVIHHHHTTSATRTTTAQGAAGSHRSPGAHHPATSPTTTPTVPPTFAPANATATTATYSPPSATYTLNLNASRGPCWVLVQSVSSGQTLFTGTIPQGSQQAVPGTGAVTLEIGAPTALDVTLGSTPVTLPSGYQTPFTMTFQPPAGAGATTPTG